MAKMLFNKVVKYGGVKYPQNTAIEVEDGDVKELKKAGGWVVGEAKSLADAEDNDEGGDATDEKDEKPVKETAAQKKAREKAEKEAAAAAEAAKEGESGE